MTRKTKHQGKNMNYMTTLMKNQHLLSMLIPMMVKLQATQFSISIEYLILEPS